MVPHKIQETSHTTKEMSGHAQVLWGHSVVDTGRKDTFHKVAGEGDFVKTFH